MYGLTVTVNPFACVGSQSHDIHTISLRLSPFILTWLRTTEHTMCTVLNSVEGRPFTLKV